jgi:hypothetical protein
MKTIEQIRDARRFITRKIITPGLSEKQRTLLAGMSTALQWACSEGGSTLQELLDGKRMYGEQMENPVCPPRKKRSS